MKILLTACTAITMSLFMSPASAGVYGDDLSKCLVSSTTDADRALLVKWIFSAIALNKEVSPYVNIPVDVRAKINVNAAGLYMRLLTDSCKNQTHDAYKYEGQAAIGAAFQLLGQVASQGIFGDPAVQSGMTELTKHFDENKINEVIKRK